jgi:hypothetical protein
MCRWWITVDGVFPGQISQNLLATRLGPNYSRIRRITASLFSQLGGQGALRTPGGSRSRMPNGRLEAESAAYGCPNRPDAAAIGALERGSFRSVLRDPNAAQVRLALRRARRGTWELAFVLLAHSATPLALAVTTDMNTSAPATAAPNIFTSSCIRRPQSSVATGMESISKRRSPRGTDTQWSIDFHRKFRAA